MDWSEIDTLSKLPGTRGDIRLSFMTSLRELGLLSLIRDNAEMLNTFTQDDPVKEQAMGKLLVNAIYVEGVSR